MRLDKSLGQHFLISDKVISKIVLAVGHDNVLEIGPGAGSLTQQLSLDRQVIAVELDKRMIDVLAETSPQAEVIQGDALQLDLHAVITRLDKPRALVSNMPYNITGSLLDRFTQLRAQVECMVLMMQKEVADKVTAHPKDRRRGALSVVMQSLFQIELVANVPPGAFLPPPKVASTVLRFTPLPGDPSEALDLVRMGFVSPRKTLANNLRSRYPTVEPALLELSLSPTIRPHELTWPEWQKLHHALQ